MGDRAYHQQGQDGGSKRELHFVIQTDWVSFPALLFEVSHDEIAV